MAISGRFRVRTLLVVVGVLALLAAWPATRWRTWSHEQLLVRRLQAKDAQVTVYGHVGKLFGSRVYRITFDEYVRLSPASGSPDEPRPENMRLTADDIRALASIDGLEELDLHGDVLAPDAFAALGELKQLKTLRISQGSWDDERLQHLESLVGLEELSLEQTQTTDEGIAQLQSKLRRLHVFDD